MHEYHKYDTLCLLGFWKLCYLQGGKKSGPIQIQSLVITHLVFFICWMWLSASSPLTVFTVLGSSMGLLHVPNVPPFCKSIEALVSSVSNPSCCPPFSYTRGAQRPSLVSMILSLCVCGSAAKLPLYARIHSVRVIGFFPFASNSMVIGGGGTCLQSSISSAAFCLFLSYPPFTSCWTER